ncbi:MAG: MATE family efflux transporter [Chitinophagaceae bacterium]|jgi:putative MATE family efflux protein|nr:MATE family efflux transporter [Chitinophagaceae bacterium]MBK7677915.1 MATE family efflux transporter [Chitinophagaceae bacterium]MBK8301232.1 MATE family efflux transporter [Chitinophagaceae bacterium]MBK9464433.1 MATE family efflux transporter [Chitinophagaceae bacterium]MBK9938446.1 MATE family efflux transporter [Chitinophagaceae bacterium]
MSQSTYTNKVSYFFSLFKQSLRGGEYDYTTGSIRAAILLLAVPMILELSLESVFALVDIFFVSKLGSNAVQTVGLTESVITLVYSLAIGLSTAATAMVARRIGEKNPEAAAHAGMQALIMSLIATVFISAAGIIFAPDILRIMGATPVVIKEGAVFTRIMLGGSVVIILLFLINGIFRGAGNAAIAMRSLWIASIINIILCPAFINGWGPLPELGLKGAAIATVIGRGTGVLYQCYFLFKGKKGSISLGKEHFIIDFPLMKSLVKIAWPATFQFIIASGSWIVLAHLVAVTGGTHASAGYQIAIRNMVFFILPAWGLSNAAATLVGQNLGAKQPDRAEKSVLLTTKYNAIFMSGVMLLFIFFARPIISFFTTVPEDLKFGAQALQIMGTGYIFYGIGMVMIQALNGAGDTKTPTWINFFGFWLFQIPLAYLLVKVFKLGVVGAFIAIPVAESALAIAAWYYFKKGKWKKVKV